MPHRRAARFVWNHLAVVALCLAALVGVWSQSSNTSRIQDNRGRIADLKRADHRIRMNQARIAEVLVEIQQARVESCRRTYEAFRQVFQPFIAAAPAKNRHLFNARIDNLKSNCPRQTNVVRRSQ